MLASYSSERTNVPTLIESCAGVIASRSYGVQPTYLKNFVPWMHLRKCGSRSYPMLLYQLDDTADVQKAYSIIHTVHIVSILLKTRSQLFEKYQFHNIESNKRKISHPLNQVILNATAFAIRSAMKPKRGFHVQATYNLNFYLYLNDYKTELTEEQIIRRYTTSNQLRSTCCSQCR